jgi:Druantia protein DruA/DDE_Tnp_1-associated
LDLHEIMLRAVVRAEEPRFKGLLDAHHYLGAVAKIGHTIWYVATWQGQWLALLVVSAAAWKCAARDRWIGWERRYQYDRLHLIANNARFLILPGAHVPNLASRVLALLERRVSADWQVCFGHPLWLLETFVDPRFFHGTSYRAANWLQVGESRGFRRTRAGYGNRAESPKLVFVRALIGNARARLSAPFLDPRYHHGAPNMLLTADHMRSLPECFVDIADPRRGQGRRHPLPAALAMAAGAVLCGARGYQAIAAWAADRSQQARARFRCRYRNGRYEVPSRTRFRDLLIRIPPEDLDRALQGWNAQMAGADAGLALDGKTMRNAIDEAGQQTPILGAVGHQSRACYTQKKSPPYP